MRTNEGDWIFDKPLLRLVETSDVGEQVADECTDKGRPGLFTDIAVLASVRSANTYIKSDSLRDVRSHFIVLVLFLRLPIFELLTYFACRYFFEFDLYPVPVLRLYQE